tara:strand:+ start:264 stop:1184 length:921 start_codon:yes stop_codon:yes gene_type:complete
MYKDMNKLFLILTLFFSTFSFSQNLPIIAITEIKSTVDSPRWNDYRNAKAGNFQTMLETQLVKVGRFKIIERNRINEILSEQILQGEFSDVDTKTKVGAVDYVVYGSITKFGSKKKHINTGSVSVTKIISEFGADLKVVDITNGEIKKAESINVALETGSGTSTNSFITTDTLSDPLSEIQRSAAKLAAAVIAESIFPMKVLAWEDDTENCCGYINYGDAILSEGNMLNIVKQGSTFVDPDTGLILGSTEKVIGKLKIIETLDKFSKAELIEGQKPKGGELARSITKQTTQNSQNINQRKKLGKQL